MEMVASVGLLSYYSIYNPVEQFRVPLFSFTGSRSPTSVIELQWMAPLSSLWLNFFEPRIINNKMAHFINCTSCGKQYDKDAFEECPFCGFIPNAKTVICPNRLCGKEVSDKFDHCPFCHTLLIKPTKTAEDIINEHKRKEEELRDAIRKKYNIGEENGVDYLDIFDVENDEFEETQRIISQFYMQGSNLHIQQCKVKEYHLPNLHICHKTTKDGSSFSVYIDMLSLLQEIKSRYEELKGEGMSEEVSCISSPCKGMIININDTETIKIIHNDNDINNFVLEKEQFLKCCNANKLEFKMFHQKGDPIVFNGTQDDEEVLIDTFQVLYNLVANGVTFPNAGIKVQKWREKQKREIQALEDEIKMQKRIIAENEQRQKKKETNGKVLSIFSVFLCIIGFFFFNYITIFLLFEILGIFVLLIGLILLFSGVNHKEEYGDVYITQELGDPTHATITYKM